MNVFTTAFTSAPHYDRPTLGNVRDCVAAAPDLTNRRRQEIVSALNCVAGAVGKPITDIPARPEELRTALAGITPLRAGVSPARWANGRSLLRAALNEAGLNKMPGRHKEALSPLWAALFALLPNGRARFALSRLARFCGARGIDPGIVNDSVMTDFLQALVASLAEQPRQVHRTACSAWNTAAETIPEWPKRNLAVPDYRRCYALPWAALPLSLAEDIMAYINHLAGTDPLEEIDFRPLRPISLAARKRQATNRQRLLQFEDPVAVHGFVSMPQRIMEKYGRLNSPTRKQALRVQLAVAVTASCW